MNLFDLLQLKIPSLKPEECKIHLAVWNGFENPLDLFLEGRFREWQEQQNNRNFGRDFVVSLIQLDGAKRWLFAGAYRVLGVCSGKGKNTFRYKTEELPEASELSGRLVIHFARAGRQSYLRAENWTSNLRVSELKPERMVIQEFSGYLNVRISKATLDAVVTQEIASWKAALSSVSGVYLITDMRTGRHYVGSAYGEGGIWSRWSTYSKTGHGNNKTLRSILAIQGRHYSSNFQFAILETADTNASKDDVLRRETHWKEVLCCRETHGGYNAN